MRLYVLVRSKEDAKPRLTYQLLQKACQEQDVELIPLEQEKMLFSADSKHLIEDGSGFYRMATGLPLILAERLLVRPGLSTIYESWRLPLSNSIWEDTLLMINKGLPIIDTVFLVNHHSKEQLEAAVERIGGYPVVAKYTGLSHGQGVFLCKNYDDLLALMSRPGHDLYARLALRRFIADAVHLRLVVIGDQVVDTIKYDQPADDFRTNAVKVPTASSFEPSPEVKQLAIEAAQANGVKLAGIDVLIDSHNKAWLAEANTPCNHARNYLTNRKNLAEDLVKLLVSQIDKT